MAKKPPGPERATLTRAAKVKETGPLTRESAAKVFLYCNGPVAFREHLLLSWARTDGGRNPADPAVLTALYNLPDRWPVPRLPLQGSDIVGQGIAPGPRVGEILRALEEWWIGAGFPEDRALLEAELERLLTRSRA